jgi:glycosyltransferase involved in cell wall biosynthesis
MSRVRLYGCTVGNGSYARVTKGVAAALSKLDLLAGLVPVDDGDEWAEQPHGGFDAEVAVIVGPHGAHLASLPLRRGRHARRLMLVPMNSSYCPPNICSWTEPVNDEPGAVSLLTGLLTPSAWSMEQLAPYTDAPVTIWRHGVGHDFAPRDDYYEQHVERRDRGTFKVLHLASTARQRKGTVPLIRGWAEAMQSGDLPSTSVLQLCVSDASAELSSIQYEVEALDPSVQSSIRLYQDRLDLSDADTANLYQSFHVVAQPSRGEGFGMVPLEALCSGVPVVATTCSGHSEFLSDETPGLSAVQSGPDAKIDDGPRAVAPSVKAGAVRDALVRAYRLWPQLARDARENAVAMREQWSWDAVMRQWAEKEGWL